MTEEYFDCIEDLIKRVNETNDTDIEEQDELHVNGKKKQQRDYINGNGNKNQQQNKYSEFELAINVSNALRLHSGLVKVQGMISSLYPPYKMVSATDMNCTNCSYNGTIAYEKPEPVPRTMSKKCPNCGESTVSFSHVYVNAVNVELQDTESFSEIERLPVLLFDEYTKNIRAGERVTILGKVHIIQSGKKGKSFSFLYADSIEYEYKEDIAITEHDKNAIERFVQKYGSGTIDKLVSMFANSIIGYDHVKEGLIMCAASTGREVNSHKRTRLNALLVGDPGLAKSALLREAVKLVSNSRYESGQNSSGRSLTAIVSKEDESYVLRLGPVPLAKEAICAINELGRMNFEDQAYLLDTMEEGEFTINKYGINARIRSPTVIITSANPVKSSWDGDNNNGSDKIDLDQIPAIKPLIDRFDLMFVFRTPRDRDVIRNYADKKSDLDDKLIPNYYNYLKKHIIYARQFNPRLSDEAKSMLTEYWANLAENFDSPRILETLFRLAKARSRLKLKQIVAVEDAIETMQFYNVILQQHLHAVKIPTNPRDVTYNECISILKESKFALSLDEIARVACKRNEQVKRYLGDKLRMQDNIKLRSILAMLLNHTSVKQIQQKPVVLQWIDNNNYNGGGGTGGGLIGYHNPPLKTETDGHSSGDDETGNSNSFGRLLYDIYDAYDTQRDNIDNDLDTKKYDSKLSTSSMATSYTSYASYSNTTNTTTDQQELQKFAFECYYCKGSNFQTNDENDYQRHVIQKHPGKPCYPSKADLERLGLKAQEKDWET